MNHSFSMTLLSEEFGYTTTLDQWLRLQVHTNTYVCFFGAVGLNGKQLFRKYDRFNEDNFYKYLKQIHYKFPKCYLFLDKAPQHYKSQKVGQYFEKHKERYFDTCMATYSFARVHGIRRMLE
jgi:hypothetical protein